MTLRPGSEAQAQRSGAQAQAVALFEQLTGHAPAGVWSAPGRANLIGEHTDYNDGFVLPFAIPHRTYAAVGMRGFVLTPAASDLTVEAEPDESRNDHCESDHSDPLPVGAHRDVDVARRSDPLARRGLQRVMHRDVAAAHARLDRNRGARDAVGIRDDLGAAVDRQARIVGDRDDGDLRLVREVVADPHGHRRLGAQ